MVKKLFPFLIIFVAVLILYHPVLSTYFSQDDFFHFKVSQTDGTLRHLINLFGFHPFKERGIAFYRPISRELLFNLYYSVFGLNALPFRIFSFLVHFISVYSVYLLVQTLFHKKGLAFFVSFFFGIASANVASLYYLAGGIQTMLATAFTLLSLIFFCNFLKTKLDRFKLLAFLLFLLGISSHEQAMIIPLLLVGLIFLSGNLKNFKNYIVDLLPYFLVSMTVFYLEISIIGFSSNEIQYQVIYNIKTIVNTLFWYAAWALGLPETLIDFVLPGFRLNPTLFRYWSNYYMIIFPSFFISVVLIITASSFFKGINKSFLFNLTWFVLGLLPVLLLPLHKSTHYLTIVLLPFWTMIGLIVYNFYQKIAKKHLKIAKIYLAILLVSLVILSATSAILGSTNYWAAARGKLAQKLINDTKTTFPSLPKGAIIYFKNDPTYPYISQEWGGTSKQASVILNGSDALQLLYRDPHLQVYYEDIKIPDFQNQNYVYELFAKIY